MRTLLRNIPTRLYVEALGTWTHEAEVALDFGGMRQALGFASREDLRRMEVVFASDPADQWAAVPVSSIGLGHSETGGDLENPAASAFALIH